MSGAYSLVKHTILPLIFKISLPNRLLYVLNEPQTKSLIAINPDQDLSVRSDSQTDFHVRNIEKMSGSKLSFSFRNRKLKNCQQRKELPKSSVDFQENSPQNMGDLVPKVIGDLSFCFISTPGYYKDYSLIAVTHMTSTSTKLPVLFPGKMIGVCSIDQQKQIDKEQKYAETLEKVKYFPNETYIFPQKKIEQIDLSFAETVLQDSRDFIREKQNLFNQHKQKHDKLIPTTVLEQKMMNPFLNVRKSLKSLGLENKTASENQNFNTLRKVKQVFRTKNIKQ